MTKRDLAKLIIKSYDFKTKDDYSNIIRFLTTCLFHTIDNDQSKDIQSTIWYLQDKMQKFIKII